MRVPEQPEGLLRASLEALIWIALFLAVAVLALI
jgi:hypothetical protein